MHLWRVSKSHHFVYHAAPLELAKVFRALAQPRSAQSSNAELMNLDFSARVSAYSYVYPMDLMSHNFTNPSMSIIGRLGTTEHCTRFNCALTPRVSCGRRLLLLRGVAFTIVSSCVASELLRAMPAYKVACPSTHGQPTCLKSGLNQLGEPWQFCSFIKYDFSSTDENRDDVLIVSGQPALTCLTFG